MEEVKTDVVEEKKVDTTEAPTEDTDLENNDELEGLDTEVEEEPKKESKKKEKELLTWKVSNAQFNNYTEEAIAKPIKKYLDELADLDPTFAECYRNPERTFDECMIFVINRAFSKKESSDEICYRNAREYYMGEIKPEEYKKKLYDNVSMPAPQKKVELTEEEKKALKEQAKEEFKKEQLRKLEEKKAQEEAKAKAKAEEEERKRKEEEKARKEAEKAAKEEALKQGAFEQMSLFDM